MAGGHWPGDTMPGAGDPETRGRQEIVLGVIEKGAEFSFLKSTCRDSSRDSFL